ncbi:MAG: replicative DNA helicase, partial [Rickettsiales bacterium]|nr:replicative DNA helicase [Rickettsiales bacterium]
NKAWEKVGEFLRPEHFIESAHRKIYGACAKLIEKGHLADAITLKNYFESAGELEGFDPQYLSDLASSAVSIVNAYDYGRLVYDLALKRDLIGIGTDIVNDAFGGGEGEAARGQIEKAEQKLYDLATEGEADAGLVGFDETLKSSMGSIEQAYRNDGSISGISTGFDVMDKKLGGLHPSDLVVIAGRPGMGKTALGLNIAFNAANEVLNKRAPPKLSGPVAFFSLEMSSDQLAARVLSFSAEVQGHKMRTGGITEEEFTKIAEHSRALATLPLFIDDTPDITVSGIRTRARRLKRVHGGLALIVIDYIQLISTPGGRKSDSRVQEVSEITRQLKVLAKELDVPVIALSQLSRLVEQRDDKRPLLSDLRESGSIEQDADIVMFVYREAYYEERKEPEDTGSEEYLKWKSKMDRVRNKAEIIVAKQRHGPTGTVEVSFVGEYIRFGNLLEGSYEK